MKEFGNFLFDNIVFVALIIMTIYLVKQYQELKTITEEINDLFTKTLNKYLESKIKTANDTVDRILKSYGRTDTVSTEINRFLLNIEKGVTGTINDKVSTSNAINKFKLSKKIDLEKYPDLAELGELGTFTDEDMNSQDNGIAIARREYNTKAFRYNEKTSSFLMQYLTKLTKLPQQYIIFDAPKTSHYEENYEVFEEIEPEINSLSVLNRPEEPDVDEEETINMEDIITLTTDNDKKESK